ncbi:MAG: HAD family hydrolase [Candidatus Nanopelagicales bacterium]
MPGSESPETPPFPPRPIRGVIFDMHSTLVHSGEPAHWLGAALRLLAGDPTRGGRFAAQRVPQAADFGDIAPWAGRIWELTRRIDPNSRRDLSPGQHREVFDEILASLGSIPPSLADALYTTMPDTWAAFEDTAWVLAELRSKGIKLALLSNIGVDPREPLARMGLAGAFDAVVLSYEVGEVKPNARIFLVAADALGLPPEDLLMVGDSVEDDGGAALVGIRTLILPPTSARVRGLAQVLRLVG